MECFEVIVVNLRARCGDIYLGVDAFVLDDCKDTEVLAPHVDWSYDSTLSPGPKQYCIAITYSS